MTSTNTQLDAQDPPVIARLRRALVRKFAITSATASRAVTEYPELAADVAVVIAEPFIAEARAAERKRCADQLRTWAKDAHPMSIGGHALQVAAGKLDPPPVLAGERSGSDE